MNKLALGAVLVGLFVACGPGEETKKIILPDTSSGVCDPLAQTGCPAGQKCTWRVDATTPQYVGHIGCAPAGDKAVMDQCQYGMPGDNGFDDCQGGLVCSSFRPHDDGSWPPGFCKSICDQQGAVPMCDAEHVCVVYSGLFKSDTTSPFVAGVCNHRCDPFVDNDFDGSGAATRSTATCPDITYSSGTDHYGCYGSPRIKAPPTAFSCTRDVNFDKAPAPTGFRHRVRCDQTNGCGDAVAPTGYLNSCNQGYIPLLYENYAVQTVVCTASCKPLNCYSGNCGAITGANHFGQSPNTCNNDTYLGIFNTADGGESCAFSWVFEVDRMAGTWLKSQTSDTVGFCLDHSLYVYDSNNDGQFNSSDMPLPACKDLQLTGTHATADLPNPTVWWGASDVGVGCVDSVTAGQPQFQGKGGQLTQAQREALMRVQMPRPLYSAPAAP